MAQLVSEYARQFEDMDRRLPLFFLSGVIGTGKTHVARQFCRRACSMAIDCWHSGPWPSPPIVCFVKWAEFIESESNGVEQDAREADLTIIDDVGAETDRYKTGAPMNKLCQLLDSRSWKFTFITSNMHVKEWATIDARLGDRLLRRGQRFEIRETPSYQFRTQP